MSRKGFFSRKTQETDVKVDLNIDGSGEAVVTTGLGFLDHMLSAASFHGLFDLSVAARGDTDVDAHHLVEDTGYGIGSALKKALGNGGFRRFGSAQVPMDEALARVTLDLGGRPHLGWHVPRMTGYGSFDTDLGREFFGGFSRGALATIHVELLFGEDHHHSLEAIFKALGLALNEATRRADRGVPSTKGEL